MKKDNENEYWKKRAIRDSVKMFLNAEQTEKLIDSAYDYAKNLLTNEILALVKRAKTKTGYDIEKVIKLLKEEVPTSELILLNQMVKTTKDKKTKKHLRKALDLLAIQFRISRLDVLHTKALILAKKVGEQQEKLSTKLFKQIIEDTHKEERANLLEIREEKLPDPVMLDENNNPKKLIKLTEDVEVKPPKGSEVITPKIIDTKEVDKAQVDTLLKSSWHGDNYSKRIWKDTDQLAQKLQQLFTVESMTGMSELDMAREIEQYMHDAFMLNKNIARRLIRTEANRFHTQAKIQQWEKMGLKHVKYVAVLDNRTSDTCINLDGSIFALDELETGVNCPPMHPWCRSIIQAYFGPVITKDKAYSWNEAKKDVFKVWKQMEKQPLEQAEITKMFKKRYYIGNLPNEEYLGVLKGQKVVIEDHNFGYILSKHWGQFTQEEFLKVKEVIKSPQLFAKDPKGEENTFVLINKISENSYIDVVLTQKEKYTLIHFTVKNYKKSQKQIKKLEKANVILYNSLQ